MTLLFVVDVILVLALAYGLAAALRLPTRPSFFIAFFVLVWADLVLAAEVLSLLKLLTPWGFLAAHAILALGAGLVWTAAGRPRGPRFSRPTRTGLAASFRSWPDLWVLGISVGAAYALLAVINGLVPPNNLDSLVYHLTKVAFWIQHRTMAPWPSPCIHQTAFPFNVEIGSLWSMLFLRRDLLAGYVQWFSAPAAALSIFGLARGFGWARERAGFAALVFLALPMVVLQSTTTQNDLTTAAMVLAMAYLVFLGLKTGHRGALVLSGAALGLALGMKVTAVMVLPSFGLGLLYFVLTRRPRRLRPVVLWAASALAGFILLGALNYGQNVVYHRSVLGRPLNFPLSQTPQPEPGIPPPHHPRPAARPSLTEYQLSRTKGVTLEFVLSNLARDSYGLMDLTGVPQPIHRPAADFRARAGQAVFAALRVKENAPGLTAPHQHFSFEEREPVASEAGAFFGPLGFLLFLPLALYWTVKGLIRKDGRLALGLSLVGFMLTLAASQAWIENRGRYYTVPIALVAPLLAGVAGRGKLRSAARGIIVLVGLTTLTVTLLTNVQKPLIGPKAIWGRTPLERRGVLWRQMSIPYRIMDEWIPEGARVATILRGTDPEYVWFGEHLGRRLYPIFPPPAEVNEAWLETQDYDCLVVHSGRYILVRKLPEDKYRVVQHPPYTLILPLK
jgi:hypothetical protein